MCGPSLYQERGWEGTDRREGGETVEGGEGRGRGQVQALPAGAERRGRGAP